MYNDARARRAAAANEFAHFQNRADVKRVTTKYADYITTPDGMMTSIQLSCFAISYLSGVCTREEYDAAVQQFAGRCNVPLGDIRVLAECSLRVLRSIGSHYPADALSH